MVIGGSSLFLSVGKMIDMGRSMAGEMLEAAAEDIQFAAGAFRIAGTDRSVSIAEVAAAVGYESESAFHRAFKREMGVSPAVWRRERSGG